MNQSMPPLSNCLFGIVIASGLVARLRTKIDELVRELRKDVTILAFPDDNEKAEQQMVALIAELRQWHPGKFRFVLPVPNFGGPVRVEDGVARKTVSSRPTGQWLTPTGQDEKYKLPILRKPSVWRIDIKAWREQGNTVTRVTKGVEYTRPASRPAFEFTCTRFILDFNKQGNGEWQETSETTMVNTVDELIDKTRANREFIEDILDRCYRAIDNEAHRQQASSSVGAMKRAANR